MNAERVRDLLFIYLNGTINKEELDELLTYVNNEAYTEVFYQSMDEEWEKGKFKALITNDQQQMVYQQLTADPRFASSRDKKNRLTQFRLFNLRTISAAALITIVSLVTYLAIHRGQQPAQYANDVNPGTIKATLTLADGRKITLDQAKTGKLAEVDGISVTKTVDGHLAYTVLGNGKADASQNKVQDYNTLETPKGGEYQLNLPDGTKVWLNAASTLKYPTNFVHVKDRKVFLNGEAYFEVAHNKSSPFRVVTYNQEVEVLGTHFNVNAYANEPDSRTTLLEGAVKISHLAGSKDLVLKPGQQAQVGPEFKVVEVDPETAVAWKNGDFILKDEDFKASMRKFARWYNVEVIYDESAPEDLELGGWVSRSKNISAVLQVIEATGKVHFKVQGRRVTVTK